MPTAKNPFDLKGKIILITGGNGFLGQHFATALREAGATVLVTDIGGEPDIRMDVTDPTSIASAFSDVIVRHEKIDVVINNAAIDPKFDAGSDPNSTLFENYPEALLDQSLQVNLKGYVLVAQGAVREMLQQKTGGHIINISSIYGLTGPDQRIYPNGTQKPVDYAVTKGGVRALTKWLATTYGDKGIRANTYTLGGVFKEHDEAFVKNYGSRTPLRRMAQPEEVGGPLVFLASEASSYMTGTELVADGGWTAW